MSLARSRSTLLALGAVVFLGLLAGILPASAATYYVNNQTDFNTYKNATFAPGDQILFARGASFTGCFYPHGSGTAQNPIVIDAYGTGALPSIYCGMNQPGTQVAGVMLENVSYWTVQNLDIKYKIKTSTNVRACNVLNSQDNTTISGLTFRNLVIHDLGGSGSTGFTSYSGDNLNGRRINNMTVDGCTFNNLDCWAMWNGGKWTPIGDYSQNSSGFTFTNNTFYNTWVPIDADGWKDGYIAGNVGHDTYSRGYGQSYIWACKNVVWEEDEYYKMHTSGNDGGGIDIDSVNNTCTAQYNYNHDCDGYGIAILGSENQPITTNITLRYNILANNNRSNGNSYGEIVNWSGSWYLHLPTGDIGAFSIYNNTIYSNPAPSVAAFNESTGSYTVGDTRIFKNNIIYAPSGYFIYAYSDTQLNNNLYWNTGGTSTWKYGGLWNGSAPTTYTTFASYQSGSGQDAAGQYANPQFVGPISPAPNGRANAAAAFALQSSSPAINAGAIISGAPNRDFIGNAIVGAPDIGALESGSAPQPPPAPTGLTATPGDQQVTLNWNASSGATSYTVKRGTTSGGPYNTTYPGITATTYTNTGLTNGVTYYYVVSAVNSAGESPNSNEASATPQPPPIPNPPTGLTATPGNQQVTLNWNASQYATSYKVYRGTSSGNYDTIYPGITTTSYTNTGLTNGVTYYYAVKAVNSSGESGYSSEVSATPQSGGSAPTNLTVQQGRNHKLILNWDAVAGADTYNVYRSTVSGGPYTQIKTGLTTTTYEDSLPAPGTYYYVVTAVDNGVESGYSNEASGTPKWP